MEFFLLGDDHLNPSLMGFSSLGGGYNIYPSTCPADGIFPTQKKLLEPPLMGFPYSEAVTTSIHPSTCPIDGIFLTRRIVSVHSVDGIFLTWKCQCKLAYGLFLRELDCPHSESPTLRRDFPLPELPSDGIAFAQTTYTSLRASLI